MIFAALFCRTIFLLLQVIEKDWYYIAFERRFVSSEEFRRILRKNIEHIILIIKSVNLFIFYRIICCDVIYKATTIVTRNTAI